MTTPTPATTTIPTRTRKANSDLNTKRVAVYMANTHWVKIWGKTPPEWFTTLLYKLVPSDACDDYRKKVRRAIAKLEKLEAERKLNAELDQRRIAAHVANMDAIPRVKDEQWFVFLQESVPVDANRSYRNNVAKAIANIEDAHLVRVQDHQAYLARKARREAAARNTERAVRQSASRTPCGRTPCRKTGLVSASA